MTFVVSEKRKEAVNHKLIARYIWRTVKYEEVYLKSYDSANNVIEQIGQYMQFYNKERPHQSLRYRTPAGIYFQ